MEVAPDASEVPPLPALEALLDEPGSSDEDDTTAEVAAPSDVAAPADEEPLASDVATETELLETMANEDPAGVDVAAEEDEATLDEDAPLDVPEEDGRADVAVLLAVARELEPGVVVPASAGSGSVESTGRTQEHVTQASSKPAMACFIALQKLTCAPLRRRNPVATRLVGRLRQGTRHGTAATHTAAARGSPGTSAWPARSGTPPS